MGNDRLENNTMMNGEYEIANSGEGQTIRTLTDNGK